MARNGTPLSRSRVALGATLLLPLVFALPALAALGDCGQPVNDKPAPLASDALFVLRSGVGLLPCELCVCDTNNNGRITAPDALLVLQAAVGLPVALNCPAECEVTTTTTSTTSTTTTTTTTSTTTTTLNCPPSNGLNDVVFNETYSCEEMLSEGAPYCADLEVFDAIRFTLKGGGGGIYEVRDEPDSGFVYEGTLDCTTFTWDASEPGEYTETGVWEFAPDLASFSGSSTYFASDDSYSGACNENGSTSPIFPPSPTPPPACE